MELTLPGSASPDGHPGNPGTTQHRRASSLERALVPPACSPPSLTLLFFCVTFRQHRGCQCSLVPRTNRGKVPKPFAKKPRAKHPVQSWNPLLRPTSRISSSHLGWRDYRLSKEGRFGPGPAQITRGSRRVTSGKESPISPWRVLNLYAEDRETIIGTKTTGRTAPVPGPA